MSVDPTEVARNVEQDLMERKARQFRQPRTHVPLPEFSEHYAPAVGKKPVKKRSATFYHSLFGELREVAMKSSDPLHADQLLRLMEDRGWPTVDAAQIGAPTLTRHGTLGGSQGAWETVISWAESGQLKLLVTQAIHNPSLFTAPETTEKTRRR